MTTGWTGGVRRAARTLWRDLGEADIGAEHALALLFLKCLSARAPDGSAPPAWAGFPGLLERRAEPGNGARIDAALRAAEANGGEALRGVAGEVGFGGDAPDGGGRDAALGRLLEFLAGLEPDPGSLGAAFEALADLLAEDRAGRHIPPALADLVAGLLDPRPGETVCDPVCGYGALLATCGRRAREGAGGAGLCGLFGQESDGAAWAVARMRLFLCGEDAAGIGRGDALRDPWPPGPDGSLARFDAVAAHLAPSPPGWDPGDAGNDRFGRFRRGLPPRTKSDYGYLSHLAEAMDPATGRAAAIVSHGALFRGGSEARIRQGLIEDGLVDAVIGLPEKLLPGTGIPLAVLVLRRLGAGGRILFIDAGRGYQPGRHRNSLRAEDVRKILETYRRREPLDGYARPVGLDEIRRHGFSLNLRRYMPPVGDAGETALEALWSERAELLEEFAALEAEIEGHLRNLGTAIA